MDRRQCTWWKLNPTYPVIAEAEGMSFATERNVTSHG
jgi:hypothetical protein